MDEIDSKIESFSDGLVYDSLIKQGCLKTAKHFLKFRNPSEIKRLQGIELQDLIKNQLEEAVETISDALVYNYLKNKAVQKLLKGY